MPTIGGPGSRRFDSDLARRQVQTILKAHGKLDWPWVQLELFKPGWELPVETIPTKIKFGINWKGLQDAFDIQ